MISRRKFLLQSASAVAVCAWHKAMSASIATELSARIGLQLYSVRQAATKDLAGTLQQIAVIGYRHVETAGFYGKSAQEFAALLANHGLKAVAAHFSMAELQQAASKCISDAAQIGAQYVVCAFPAARDGRVTTGLALSDWLWNAEELNRIGALARQAGLQMSYHNHNMEFLRYQNQTAWDYLLARTDRNLVTFELDIAWAVIAGIDPAKLLALHADRISLLHIKDVKEDAAITADQLIAQSIELGRGQVDWPRVLAACDPRHIEYLFVEQENFEQAPLAAARENYWYLRKMLTL